MVLSSKIPQGTDLFITIHLQERELVGDGMALNVFDCSLDSRVRGHRREGSISQCKSESVI